MLGSMSSPSKCSSTKQLVESIAKWLYNTWIDYFCECMQKATVPFKLGVNSTIHDIIIGDHLINYWPLEYFFRSKNWICTHTHISYLHSSRYTIKITVRVTYYTFSKKIKQKITLLSWKEYFFHFQNSILFLCHDDLW